MIRDRFPLCLCVLFTVFGRAPAETPSPSYVTTKMEARAWNSSQSAPPAKSRPADATGASTSSPGPTNPSPVSSAPGAVPPTRSAAAYLTTRQLHRAGLATTFALNAESTGPTSLQDVTHARPTSSTLSRQRPRVGLATTSARSAREPAPTRTTADPATSAAAPAAPWEVFVRSNASTADAPAIVEAIRAEAADAGLRPELLAALIYHESRFNPHARGAAGERGLCQILRGAPWDIAGNVRMGARILAAGIKAEDSERLGAARFNGGPRGPRVARCLRYADAVLRIAAGLGPSGEAPR